MAFSSIALLCSIAVILAIITPGYPVPTPQSFTLRVTDTKVKKSGVFSTLRNGNAELFKGIRQAKSTPEDAIGGDKNNVKNGVSDDASDDGKIKTDERTDDTEQRNVDGVVKDEDNDDDDGDDDDDDDDNGDDEDDDDDGDDDKGKLPSGGNNASATRTSDPLCFPGSATVQLVSGTQKRMSDLAVGDCVQVGPSQFSEVFMFTHKMSDVNHKFVTLRTAAGPTLSLTSLHYLHSSEALVAAGSVKVGDALQLADGSLSRVVEVTATQLTGLYNPQTVHGSIAVDGVLASTYTAAVRPKAAHAMLAPLRALYHRIAFVIRAGEKGGGGIFANFPMGGVHEAL